jgi:D-arabinonate dehydratase
VKIETVRARTLRLPLRRAIRTSNLSIEAREFVLVEIVAEGGLSGRGFGFTRDGLVAQTVDANLAPLLVGEDARLTERIWERLYLGTRYLGRKGLLMRALSAVDIALWDLRGKALGAPLWELLGGYREHIPAHVAGGYYGPSSDEEAVGAEFAGYRSAGYRGAKINVGGLPFERDLARVAAARAALGAGVGLAVDFNGSLASVHEALRWARELESLDIAFLEEPFLMDALPAMRGLRARSPLPIAIGEDESGRWAFRELLEPPSLDILRHDATLAGGVSEWVKIAGLALAHDVALFPHWFPEIHVHVAAAFPSCVGVELIDPASGVMNLHELMENPLTQRDGYAEPPSGPGLGIVWDERRIEAATV